MSMPKGKKVVVGYATVAEEDGANYRTISEIMTSSGSPMNHASARNHVLRVMKKFAEAIAEATGQQFSDVQLTETARDPQFQAVLSDMLQRQYAA